MNKTTIEENINDFMAKVKKMEKGERLDLSSDQDLSIAIMNLISMEEHFFFTYNKTKDSVYLDLLSEVREMRKSLLKKIIKDYEGEVWCISKHLLAASMRIMEVGTKALTKGDKKSAAEFFQKSYKLYNLFWGLNLGVIKTKDIKRKDDGRIDLLSEDEKSKKTATVGIFDKIGALVKKAVDCCIE